MAGAEDGSGPGAGDGDEVAGPPGAGDGDEGKAGQGTGAGAGPSSDARVEAGGHPAAGEGAEARLGALRGRIVELDDELIRLVGSRRDLVLEVGRLKESLGMPVLDPAQEARVVRRAAERARELGVDEELARDVIWRIIASARATQEGRSSWGPPEPPFAAPPSDS